MLLIIAALAVIISVPSLADDSSADNEPEIGTVFTVDGITYEITNNTGGTNNTVKVLTGDVNLTRLTINATVGYKPETLTYTYYVTEIADNAFKDFTKLTAIDLGSASSLTTIGAQAFYGCINVKGSIYSNATTIGEKAFYKCTGLETITMNKLTSIPTSAFERCSSLLSAGFSKATSIGNRAFMDCSKLETCYSDKVTSVGDTAFYRCYKLSEVSIPSHVVTIGDDAYRYCYALEELDLESCDDLTTIGVRAFYDCTGVTSLTTPASLTEIKDTAFEYCNKLKTVEINSGLTTLGSSVFYGCSSLESFTVDSGNTNFASDNGALCKIISASNYTLMCCPAKWGASLSDPVTFTMSSNVVTIASNAFYNCKYIDVITIGSNVTTINDGAFTSCTSLTTIDIPASVTTISGNPFSYCTSLTAINVNSGNTNYGNNSNDGVLYLKSGSDLTELITYPTAKTGTTYTIPNTVTKIRTYAFYNNDNIENVVMTSVQTIDSYAFYSCSNLKGTQPAGESYYEFYVSATKIDYWAFRDCTSLDHVKLNHQLNSIVLSYYYSFYNCTSLSYFDMDNMDPTDKYYTENGVLYKRDTANSDVILTAAPYAMTTVTIPSGVTNIGPYAFYGTLVQTVNLSPTVDTIDINAFYNCSHLTSITATDSSYFATDPGTSILYSADYTKLILCPTSSTTSVIEINDACTTINSFAFNSCTNITHVTIPENITTIGQYAFSGCYQLTRIDFEGVSSLSSVGEGAFSMGTQGNPMTCNLYGCPDDKFIDNTNSYTTLRYNHYVHFDLNGGTGGTKPASVSNTTGETFNLPAFQAAWTKDGYHAIGWCDTADETGTVYTWEGPFAIHSADMTLYIRWVENECKIELDANYDDGTDGQAYATYNSSTFSTETGKEFAGVTRNGYTLNGYYTAATGGSMVITAAGALVKGVENYTDASGNWINTVAHEGTVTLYAQWTANTYTVTLDRNDGIADGSATYTFDSATYDAYTAVSRTGYKLLGYYTSKTPDLNTESPVMEADGTLHKSVAGYSDADGKWKYYTTSEVTLYAVWEIITYDITYELDGGTNHEDNPATYDYETDTITLGTPTKTGYEFKGWFTDSEMTQSITQIAKNSTGDKTLYAKWELETYTITYHLDGGTNHEDNPSSYTYESDTITFGYPTKTGYTFSGWFSDSTLTTDYSHIEHNSTGDKDVYAKWTENNYKVVFTDGTQEEEQSFTYTESKALRANTFVKSTYKLTGWATTSGGTKVYDDQQVVSQLSATNNDTVTLYAVWEQKGTYHAYFYDGATPISDKTITKIADETYILPGYTSGTNSIAGWNSKSDGTGTFYSVGTSMKMEEADITFYAQWTVANAIVVHYDVNGGSTTLVDVHVVKNTSFNLAYYDGVKTGYHLLGWKTSGDDTTYAPGDSFTVGESDLTFVAQWAANQYTMVFEKNNTTTESGTMASQTFTYDAASTPLTSNAFVKTGYSFYGWSFTKDGTTTDRVFTDGQSLQNYTDENGKVYHLYPIWTINQYTVTADLTNGTISADPTGWTKVNASKYTKDFDYNTSWANILGNFVGSSTLSRTGYKDPVWDKTTGYLGAADDTMTLSWTACTYTVTFDKQSGTGGSDSVTATFDSAMPSATMPTLTGYTFGGYYTGTNGSGTQYYTAAGASAKNWDIADATTLYAKWTINTYTVTADLNGGTIAADPSGWTKVNASKYTKSFDYNTAWTDIQSDFETGGSITKTGYKSPAWDKTGNLGAANATMKLSWTAITFEVRFNGNGSDGGSMSNESFTYDTAKALTSNGFTKTGYSFAGWAETAEGAVKYTDGKSVKNLSSTDGATVDLYAKWTANPYKVRFNGNGSTSGTMQDESFVYDTEKALDANTFIKTGYSFAGWAKTAEGSAEYTDGQTVNNLTATKDDVVNLYAKWTANTYTVSFTKTPGSGGTDSFTATYDATPASITIPTYTGYTFMGYFTETGGAGTKYFNGDGTGATDWKETGVNNLFAYWTANHYEVVFNKNSDKATGTMSNQSFTYDEAEKELTQKNFSRIGYTFGGWATTPEGTAVYADQAKVQNLTSDPDGKFNLYAVWVANSYKIDLNGHGAEDGFLYVTYDSSEITNKSLKFRTGYTLTGYYLTNDDPSTKIISYSGGENVSLIANIEGLTDSEGKWIYAGVQTFHAKWTINSYTVTVDLNGGTMDNVPASWAAVAGHSDQWTKSFEYSTSWDTIKKDFTSNDANAPVKTGHQDPVWSPSAGNLPAEDSTLSVSWTVTKYTVTAALDKGTVSSTPAGWTYDSVNDVYTRDFDYDTSWAIIQYTFTDPTSPVYTFTGWDKEGNLGAGPETMTAEWTPNVYTVVIDLSGGVVTGPLGEWIKISDNNYVCNFPYETTWTQITDAFPAYERPGYSFVDWTYPVEEFHEDFQTVKANWLAGSFTVTFDSNGGTDPSFASKEVVFGQAYGELATVSKGGCVFVGWFTASNDLVTSTTTVGIASDHTLYAQYYGDSTVHVNVPTGGPGYIVTPGPTKIYTGSSYTFQIRVTEGYTGTINVTADGTHGNITYSGDLSNMSVTIENVMSDIDTVVISGIVPMEYILTLDNGGSKTYAVVQFNCSLPEDVDAPSKTGYVFGGYYTEKDGKGDMYYSNLMESQTVWTKNSDGTLYAYWIADKEYTVTYDLNGGNGTAPAAQSVLQGTIFMVSGTDASKNDYTFGGWSDGSRTYQPGDFATMGAYNITLKAIWNYNQSQETETTDISGRVIDSYDTPFPLADIYIDGVYYATTDANGAFDVKGITKDIHSLMANTLIGNKLVFETVLIDLRNGSAQVDVVIENYSASSVLKLADGSELTVAVENLNKEANSQYAASDVLVKMTVDNSLKTLGDKSSVFQQLKDSMGRPYYQIFNVTVDKTCDGQTSAIAKTNNVLKLAVKMDTANMKSIIVSDYVSGSVKAMKQIGVNDAPEANSFAVDNGWIYLYLDSSAPVAIGYEQVERSFLPEICAIATILTIIAIIAIYLVATRGKH